MSWRGLLLTCLGLVSTVIAANEAASGVTGLLGDVVFNQYAPLSSSAELARRLVSPLNARRLQQQAAATGAAIRDQPIDLAQERFALYVPPKAPPGGYALLVFVPPWNEAKVPPEWIATLQKQGVILVTAANIGNDANVLDRREPVALLAAYNTMSRYRVDPRRVYVGGFRVVRAWRCDLRWAIPICSVACCWTPAATLSASRFRCRPETFCINSRLRHAWCI
jgi:hypothetical protein